MSPWITPTEPTELEGDALRDHYQLILRRIWKWTIYRNEDLSPELRELYNAVSDAKRSLNRPGNSIDVVSIDAVIETAIQLGYSSDN